MIMLSTWFQKWLGMVKKKKGKRWKKRSKGSHKYEVDQSQTKQKNKDTSFLVNGSS